MIYLGVITERVPILPPFTPSHVLQDGEAWVLPFGEVFDVPRMQKAMNIPILEWHDVKREEDGERDELGCWNIWEVTQHREAFPRYSSIPDYLNLGLCVVTIAVILLSIDAPQQIFHTHWRRIGSSYGLTSTRILMQHSGR